LFLHLFIRGVSECRTRLGLYLIIVRLVSILNPRPTLLLKVISYIRLAACCLFLLCYTTLNAERYTAICYLLWPLVAYIGIYGRVLIPVSAEFPRDGLKNHSTWHLQGTFSVFPRVFRAAIIKAQGTAKSPSRKSRLIGKISRSADFLADWSTVYTICTYLSWMRCFLLPRMRGIFTLSSFCLLQT